MLTSDLTDIVSTIRRDFENGKINDKELKLLYLQYSLLKDIGLFVDRAKLLFPHLNCGLASVYLQKLFPQAKIVQGKYNQHNHTFLLIEELIVIDITSDQYGGPKVYVGPLQRPWFMNIQS